MMERSLRLELSEAALGKRPCELCIENVRLVNVFTKEILLAKVFIYKGWIAEVDYDGSTLASAQECFDGENLFLAPGLIDAHVHIESSMLTPKNFAEAVLPHGTTTVVTDPHEMANVLGVEGVRYMLDVSEHLPMNQYVLVPSCVPSVEGMENAGASFFAEDVAGLLKLPRVLGVAELMDYVGVINGSPRMADIIDEGAKIGAFLQGHAPQVRGAKLSAYLNAGVQSCHENRFGDEALEKMRKGMWVDARESSISKNMAEIVNCLPDKKNIPVNFCVCTDDKEAYDLIHSGHVNHALKVAVEAGLDPVAAVAAATLHVSLEIGLHEIGAITPRRRADMVLFKNLKDFEAASVFFQGKLVAQNGKLTAPLSSPSSPVESHNSVHIGALTTTDFTLKAPLSDVKSVKVNILSFDSPEGRISQLNTLELPVKNGVVDISGHKTLNYAAVVNRHGKGTIFLGLIENFHINSGAFAGTVGHDSHNLTVVYTDPEDALTAVNRIKDLRGGIVCVREGNIMGEMALPIGGLLTDKALLAAPEEIRVLNAILKKEFALEFFSPLMRISTITLIVSPKIKFSDMGMVDVEIQKFIPVFP